MTERRNAGDNPIGSFAGLRVLDFSTTIAGPHCTRMLADMGAEVIKVEPAEGETMRTRPPVRNRSSSVFGGLNAGKKSLVLDLKSPAAVDMIRRLGAMDRETIRHELEGNICRCTGYVNIVSAIEDASRRIAGEAEKAA